MTNIPLDNGCHVILGLSSVGKSKFISQISSTNTPGKIDVVMAYEIERNLSCLDRGNTFVHYNMMRPYNNSADCFPADISSDPVARILFIDRPPPAVTMLVARPATIAKRILLREHIEPELKNDETPYPYAEMFDFVLRTDVSSVYEEWINFLTARQIPIRFISTDDDSTCTPCSASDALSILRSREPQTYSCTEREQALNRFPFRYQGRDGRDCSRSLAAIDPFLEGPSLLDIGCAEGFFCFEAERRGFTDVLGIEIRSDRFLAACAYREVSGSKCSFELRDLFSMRRLRTFDTVLLLNVLHHVDNPIKALVDISALSRKRVILEYPTLEDGKFLDTIGAVREHLNSLPLIGVSRLSDQDQTFVFTDGAIRRICIENLRLFRRVQFMPSPRAPGRSIAVCDV